MKLIPITLIFLSLFTVTITNAQSVSCQDAYDYVVKNHDHRDSTNCFGSSMLTKVEYYQLDGQGYVVAYIKQNDYDITGRPYLFCNISKQRWNTFKIEGAYYSWGKKFHEYIIDNKCNCY